MGNTSKNKWNESNIIAPPADFYVAGGTLHPDAPSYVERQADRDLFDGLVKGQFCYVLTARQMGKSSLMVRMMGRLRSAGIAVAILDLTAIGQNLTLEQWYWGLLLQMGERLDLEQELTCEWQNQSGTSFLQSWVRTICQVVVPRFPRGIVIFIDEIDMVLNLPFSVDEFFAGIRGCYNERSQSKEMERLTFCLLGVAAPTDLVRSSQMTPFNIGRRIELHDFTEQEAMLLAEGLRREGARGIALLRRTLHWTGGHPYLTQRLCLTIAEDSRVATDGDVDRLCLRLFLSPNSYDDNLLFVQEHILGEKSDLGGLLEVYRRIMSGGKVADEPTDPTITVLRLSGITRSVSGRLRVRNRIYSRFFDAKWIETSMPDAELRRQRAAYRRGVLRATFTVTSLIALLLGAVWVVFIQRKRTEEAEMNRRLSYDAEIRLAQEELNKANIERVNELLQETIPRADEPDLRGFEWYHFWNDVHQEAWRARGDHPIVSVGFSPSGKSLVVGESTWTNKAEQSQYLFTDYSVSSHEHTPLLPVAADISFHQIAISPDQKRVLVPDPYFPGAGSRATASLWDLSSGRKIAHFGPHYRELSYLALSFDGKSAATADMGGQIRIWETASGQERLSLKNGLRRVTWVAFSPCSQLLGTADDSQAVRLWNLRTGRSIGTLSSPEAVFTGVVFFPDGKRVLTATNDGTLQIWDLRKRKKTGVMAGHSGYVKSIVFSPSGGLVATGGYDRTVRIWSITTGDQLRVIKGHGSAVFGIAWSPDEKYLITGASDNNIKIWTMAAKAEPQSPVKVVQYLATAFSSTNELYAMGTTSEGKAVILNLSAGQQVSSLRGLAGDLLCAVFSPDRKLLATGGTAGTIQLWDVATGEIKRSFSHQPAYIYGLTFSPDGSLLVSGDKEGRLIMWSVPTGSVLTHLSNGVENSWRTAFSADGRYLATAADGGLVQLWDVKLRRVVGMLDGHIETVRAMAFSSNGQRLVTAGDDSRVVLWDVGSRRRIRSLGLADHVQRAILSPDGKRLVTGGVDGTVKLWDMNTNQELIVLQGHSDEVTSITFSLDSKALATTGLDGTVRLWRAAGQGK